MQEASRTQQSATGVVETYLLAKQEPGVRFSRGAAPLVGKQTSRVAWWLRTAHVRVQKDRSLPLLRPMIL